MVRKGNSTKEENKSSYEDQQQLIDYSWKLNSYLSQYINFADAKAGAIVTVFFLIIGLYTSLYSTEVKSLTYWLGIIVTLSPILFALTAITPRLRGGEGKGIIFWNHITEYENAGKYKQELTKADLFNELVLQNYRLAKVASRKYKCLKWSFYFTWVALLYLTLYFLLIS